MRMLEQLLTGEGPWRLVHFTGHSHFVGSEEKGVGYVFVPKATTRAPCPRPSSSASARWRRG